MAFKSFNQYQEDKNGDFFVLPNDKDSADVVFLYQSADDALIADAHYINTPSYKGYVHCCGSGCPACAKYQNEGVNGLKVQNKLFIPMYNISKNKIEFWDRTPFFEQVLQKNVFGPFPNPSETVFRITRNGEANDRNTKYSIQPIGRNVAKPYAKILSDFKISLPDAYSMVIKEMTPGEISAAFASQTASSDLGSYDYVPVPRESGLAAQSEDIAPTPQIDINIPDYSQPVEPSEVPNIPDYTMNGDLEAASNSEPLESDDSIDNVSF